MYVTSWVDEKVERCYQVMEAPERRLLDEWISNWSDLVDFEVWPVITSGEAAAKMSRHDDAAKGYVSATFKPKAPVANAPTLH